MNCELCERVWIEDVKKFLTLDDRLDDDVIY